MSENETTIVAELQKTTKNYAVYEAEDGDSLTGMYVSLGAFEAEAEDEEDAEPFETVEVTVGGDSAVTLVKDKDTKNFGNYASEAGVVDVVYLSHDVLGSEESEEDGFTAPDEVGIALAEIEQESQDEDEVEISDEDEVEISDEEIGLIQSDD